MSVYVKPTLYLLLVASFVGITVRRVRDLGLPVGLAAVVPLLMLGDVMFGMTFGGPWSLAFTFGVISQQFPRSLLMALMCIGFLCIARSSEEAGANDGQRWGLSGALTFGIVVLSSIGAALSLAQHLAGVLSGLAAMQAIGKIPLYWGLFGTPALLLVCLAFVVRRQRGLA